MIERTKPFDIPKSLVFSAYKKVKENRGGAGIDDLTIEKFDQDLSKNLYKLWNRLSSGSYFPPAVKACDIIKTEGGTRTLGIPTVADRIAQEVVRSVLEPELEKVFDEDSYGYRPNKSALDAIGKTRRRCFDQDWLIEFDIKGMFDNIDNEGRTPLDYAISSGKEELIKILTEKTLLSDEGQVSLEQEVEISLDDQYEDAFLYCFSSDEYREVPLESATALI